MNLARTLTTLALASALALTSNLAATERAPDYQQDKATQAKTARVRIINNPRRIDSRTPACDFDIDPFRGHYLPQLRGANVVSEPKTGDLEDLLTDWNANLVRWQIVYKPWETQHECHGPLKDVTNMDQYRTWFSCMLDQFDNILPTIKENGARIIFDLHSPPGERGEKYRHLLFSNEEYKEEFVALWHEVAERYRDEPAVWAYDILNEPIEPPRAERIIDWHTLATETANTIRNVDDKKAIIIEPQSWATPEVLGKFTPIPVEGIVYSIHLYVPHQYTHQGVHSNPMGVEYPGWVEEDDGPRYWDEQQLRQALQPARDFQLKNNAHVFVGEFSAARWAPGAHEYLRDAINLFEEYDWDWAYHSFREAPVWSLEHGPDPDNKQPAPYQTDREKLIRKWFDKNVTGCWE